MCLTRDADFSSASASTKNLVILSVAIPPPSVEAPDSVDRFRFPASHAINAINSGSNGKCLEVGASGRILETVPATPDPLHVTFDGDQSPSGGGSSGGGAACLLAPEGTSAVRPAQLPMAGRSHDFNDGGGNDALQVGAV